MTLSSLNYIFAFIRYIILAILLLKCYMAGSPPQTYVFLGEITEMAS